MKTLLLLLCSTFVLTLLSCSHIWVRSEYDEEIAFEEYKTFKWMARKKSKKRTVREDSGLERKIKAAVEKELRNKGLVVEEFGETDAILASHVVSEKNVVLPAWGYARWYRPPHTYRSGTIVVDIVDPELEQLVWRGAVSYRNGSVEQINKAIAKVFEKYPPQG